MIYPGESKRVLERVQGATGGRFHVHGLISVGETILVYHAEDLLLKRTVALKAIARQRASDSADEVVSHARPATSLRHPNIVSPYVIEDFDDLLVVAMPFVNGVSLEQVLHTLASHDGADWQFPIAAVQSILLQVARGLGFANGEGVIHGHLKPSNVMITAEGDAVITDFGMDGVSSRHTDSQVHYMSPEQFGGEPACFASDQFSLGIMAYELVAGTRALQMARDGPWAKGLLDSSTLRALRPDAPLSLGDAIMRMLARNPGERFASMHEVLEAIEGGFTPQNMDVSARQFLREAVSRARDVYALHNPPYIFDSGERELRREPEPAGHDEPDKVPETTARALDENVQFTVYRPAVVRPAEWYQMLVFAHLTEARAGSEEQDPVAIVEQQAKQILEGQPGQFQKLVEDSAQAVPREGTITIVPEIAGVEFNPPQQAFQWLESVHRADFRLRADAARDGTTVHGRVTVYHGVIILAEVTLSIRIARAGGSTSASLGEPVRARPYRKIFASYSHKDVDIVQQFERYAATLGDRYLRDANDLRAGEEWSERLSELIRDADILQLFWSRNSMASGFVRQEWEYALSLGRPNFIRPTYWEEPLPATEDGKLPPEALRRLHFQQIRASTETASHRRCRNCGQVRTADVRYCPMCGFVQASSSSGIVLPRHSGPPGPSAFERPFDASPSASPSQQPSRPRRRTSRALFALTTLGIAGISIVLLRTPPPYPTSAVPPDISQTVLDTSPVVPPPDTPTATAPTAIPSTTPPPYLMPGISRPPRGPLGKHRIEPPQAVAPPMAMPRIEPPRAVAPPPAAQSDSLPSGLPTSPLQMETLEHLLDAYRENEVAAQSLYGRRYFIVSHARVVRRQGDSASAFVMVDERLRTVRALARGDAQHIADVQSGPDGLSLICRVDGIVEGQLQLSDCRR